MDLEKIAEELEEISVSLQFVHKLRADQVDSIARRLRAFRPEGGPTKLEIAAWAVHHSAKHHTQPEDHYRVSMEAMDALDEALSTPQSIQSADVMRENEELKRIRDLCIKSLVKATGRNEESIRDAPYTCASKHAAEVAALRSASVDTKRMDFMERFIVEGTCPEGGKIEFIAKPTSF